MSRRKIWVAAVAAALAVGVTVAQLPAQGGTRTRKIFMSAVEYKGGTNVADEAYPPAEEPGTLPLEPTGGGYKIKPPDDSGRWEVSSYRFEPGFFVAKKGERIVLEIAGINGALHDGSLISPSGAEVRSFVTTRGRLTLVRFRASQVGIWRLVCSTHPPAMEANILVLP